MAGGTDVDRAGRQLPFSTLEIKTLITPNLIPRPAYDGMAGYGAATSRTTCRRSRARASISVSIW